MLRSPSRPLQPARASFRGIRLPETSVLRQRHALWLHGWLIGWRCALCTGAGCAVYLLLLRQRRPADAPDPVTDLLDAATDASTHSAGGSALAASGEGGDFAGGVDSLPDSAAEGVVDGVADAGGAAEKGARRR